MSSKNKVMKHRFDREVLWFLAFGIVSELFRLLLNS